MAADGGQNQHRHGRDQEGQAGQFRRPSKGSSKEKRQIYDHGPIAERHGEQENGDTDHHRPRKYSGIEHRPGSLTLLDDEEADQYRTGEEPESSMGWRTSALEQCFNGQAESQG